MSPELANRIAAGEVVDRPSSVVKELCENSIDASAKNVRVSILSAGRKEIRVQDDGIGMDEIDAELCFLRHASSKIKSTFDLKRITTLGFRGEALPSIAAVSKVKMLTYDGISNSGYEVKIEPSKEVETCAGPKRKGTIFTVTDLFFNTPARLKYLKSDNTENSSIIEVVERLSLSYPSISFELDIDGKKVLKTSGRGSLLEAISEVYGHDIAKACVEVKSEDKFFSLNGFVAKPNISYANRYHILTFINDRCISNFKVNQAVINAYKDYLPPNRYPFVVLNIGVDYSLVDVNVHPLKREVRLSEEEKLVKLIEESVKTALRGDRPFFTSVKLSEDHKHDLESEENEQQLKLSDYIEEVKKENTISEVKDELSLAIEEINDFYLKRNEDKNIRVEKIQEEDESELDLLCSEKKTQLPDLQVIGQVLRTYIVCDGDDGIYLIDQHAAQERINFEKALKDFSQRELEVFSPLIPILIEVPSSVMAGYDEKHLNKLSKIGIELERFSSNTLRITTLPIILKDDEDISMLKDLVCSTLLDQKCDLSDLKRLAIATIACKASIRANTFLNKQHMEKLIEELNKCKNPNNCPHGRPTIIKLSKYEIEKLFKRTGF